MYRFSRAIYRELAGEIIEDPHSVCPHANHERVLRAARPRSSGWRPTATTSRGRRGRCSATSAPTSRLASSAGVLRVIERYLQFADEFLRQPAAERIRRLREPAPVPGEHAQGHAVPADAAAAQRLLPVAPAPGGDRGARDRSRSRPDELGYGAPLARGLVSVRAWLQRAGCHGRVPSDASRAGG